MSRSRVAIYDSSKLLRSKGGDSHNPEERSILIHNSFSDTYYNRDCSVAWNPDLPPFPTPLIYLKQRKLDDI